MHFGKRLVGAAALAGGAWLGGAGHAEAPQVKAQAPGYYRMMLGDFEVTALSDGTVALPPVVVSATRSTTPAAELTRSVTGRSTPSSRTSMTGASRAYDAHAAAGGPSGNSKAVSSPTGAPRAPITSD